MNLRGKRVIAAAMAVAMSVATVTTSVIPSTEMHVHAAEENDTKLADSSVEGFYYKKNSWGDIQCITDKTYTYTSYDEAVKDIGTIAKKIYLEDKYEKFSVEIPVKLETGKKLDQLEKDYNQMDKDIQKVIQEDTGKAEEGHTLFSMQNCGGEMRSYSNNGDCFAESYADGSYSGYYYGLGGYKSKRDRYHQTVKKLDQVIEDMKLDGKSDYEKLKAILYWIKSNVKYDDYYAVKDNSSMTPGTQHPHDMTGAVLDGYAVCDGFAGTFYYMANKVGLNALYDDGTSNDNGGRHAWNLAEIDGTYYYVDPTNAWMGENAEPKAELLYGQKYFFDLYTPDNNELEEKYKNISKDDYLKEHSVCKGNHNFYEAGGKVALCEQAGTIRYRCSNLGCLYKYEVETTPALGHLWDKGTITQEATCTKPEITTYLCTREGCEKGKDLKHGDKRETKSALGHSWDEGVVTKEPTCTEKGIKTLTCSRCGETTTDEIPKIKHTYEEHVVTAPTCVKKGISDFVCKYCGFTIRRQTDITDNHQNTEIRNKKEATCEEDGYTGDVYCKDCKKIISQGKVIKATGHEYGDWKTTIQPTCKKYGLKQRVCKLCGDIVVDTINKVDHTWALTSTTPATCSIGEIQHYTCSVCGETKDVTLTNPTGQHTWELTSKTDATCTKDGEKVYTCKDCGTTKTEVIDATGHQHTEIHNQKEATCEEKGYTGDTYCKDCGEKLENGKEIAALGHTWDKGKVTKEATETTPGEKTYTCKTCGKIRTEEIPMIKHNWDKGTITKEATCTEDGEITYHCTDEGCDQAYTKVIPATGHQHTEIQNQKKATCEEDGYSGDTYCKDCKQTIKTGSVIKATGHTWDDGVITDTATCQKEGVKTYTCKVCGKTKVEEISKTDHQWNKGDIKKEATCTEDGLKVYTCTVCGETKEEVLKATGHQHTEVRNEKKATCTENGYSGDVYCKDCGELIKKGSETEKAEHTWKLTNEQNATCEVDGSKTYTCEVCGETKTETIKSTGHQFSAWKTIKEQSVTHAEEQSRTCGICGTEETRIVGDKLSATITTNATSLKLKKKQKTTKFVVFGLAKGDSVRSWSSSNKKIVNVSGNANGTCTIKAGNKTGKAKITITLASGLTKGINVTVQKNAVTCTAIKNVPKKLTLNKKKSYQLRPVIEPITCVSKAKFKTSNKKVVKVTSKGKITAVKKGKAKITVMVGKKKFVCTVTVL